MVWLARSVCISFDNDVVKLELLIKRDGKNYLITRPRRRLSIYIPYKNKYPKILSHLPVYTLAYLMLYAASARSRTFAPGSPIGPSRKGSHLRLWSACRGARCRRSCWCGCAGYILSCCRKSWLFSYEGFQLGSYRCSRCRWSRSRFGYRTFKTNPLLCFTWTWHGTQLSSHRRLQLVVSITNYIGINRASLILRVDLVYARIIFSFDCFIYSP